MNIISTTSVTLRDTTETDLAIFFAQQTDLEAKQMAAFTDDVDTAEQFVAIWAPLLQNETVVMQTILVAGEIAGNVLKFERGGQTLIGYWIDRAFWGRGVATIALSQFLQQIQTRPLYAHAAKSNIGSIRVLEKCGFHVVEEAPRFSNIQDKEIQEVILELPA